MEKQYGCGALQNWHTHQMGETGNGQIAALGRAVEPMVVDTLGGRMQVCWDGSSQATPNGQLVFFAEFLRAAGVFDEWVRACPLEYRSGNAPGKRDVLGTLLLAILAGHRRYAHVTALRGDGVAAQALGMDRIVSEDALRRALSRIDETASAAWLCPALMGSVQDALEQPWILDIDASIKPLYGRQEGAEIGYNPHKPGRPSHVLHTYWVGNLRLVLDVQVSPGKQHTSAHAKAGLGRVLDELGSRRPAIVRGDCGYGNEGILVELEQRQQPYLLRLRQTKNVQRLIARQFGRSDWSRPDAQGCQVVEDHLQLTGWSAKRRVVIVRRRIRGALARESRDTSGQLQLTLAEDAVLDADPMWEYTVLVSDIRYPLEAIAQLYRDRCDCENGFDELKNQWGLGGFTTQDIARCQTTARAGTGRRAGLQLVELVLSGRPSRRTSRSGDKPAPAAGGGRHDGQPRRTDAAISHAVACEGRHDQIAGRQRSCGSGPRRARCGAVPEARPMARAAALHLRTHHRIYTTATDSNRCDCNWVTAVFRIKCCPSIVTTPDEPLPL